MNINISTNTVTVAFNGNSTTYFSSDYCEKFTAQEIAAKQKKVEEANDQHAKLARLLEHRAAIAADASQLLTKFMDQYFMCKDTSARNRLEAVIGLINDAGKSTPNE